MIITKEIFYDKMKRVTVGIAGLGGLGSNVAIALARTGIGKLLLVDFDCVERSNLNRQQYLLSQVGKLKTDSLKQNIFEINPEVEVEITNCKLDAKNIPLVFKNADEIKTLIQNENFVLVGDGKSGIENEPILTASQVGIAASFQANQIIRWIIGEE